MSYSHSFIAVNYPLYSTSMWFLSFDWTLAMHLKKRWKHQYFRFMLPIKWESPYKVQSTLPCLSGSLRFLFALIFTENEGKYCQWMPGPWQHGADVHVVSPRRGDRGSERPKRLLGVMHAVLDGTEPRWPVLQVHTLPIILGFLPEPQTLLLFTRMSTIFLHNKTSWGEQLSSRRSTWSPFRGT